MKPLILSPSYDWADVEASHTAATKGILNTLPDALAVNAARVAQTLESVILLCGPILISSWYRCLALNEAVGSKSTSAHPKALAADFIAKDIGVNVVFERIKASILSFDQLIVESTASGTVWVHLGLSEGTPRRETLRGTQQVAGAPITFTRVAAG